jgi:anti-sigma factor RsiW
MWGTARDHCSDETLVALVDDELELPARRNAERHIDACDRCAGFLWRQHHAQTALAGAFDMPAFDPLPAPIVHRRARFAVSAAGLMLGSAGVLALAGLLVHRHAHRLTTDGIR